jgi:hypothetical protein
MNLLNKTLVANPANLTPLIVMYAIKRIIIIIISFFLSFFLSFSLRTEYRASTVPRHPRLLFQFFGSIRHLVGLVGGGSVQRQASTYTGQHNTERRRQTYMPRAGFEPVIPMFERPKTVLGLDRSAIETGHSTH